MERLHRVSGTAVTVNDDGESLVVVHDYLPKGSFYGEDQHFGLSRQSGGTWGAPIELTQITGCNASLSSALTCLAPPRAAMTSAGTALVVLAPPLTLTRVSSTGVEGTEPLGFDYYTGTLYGVGLRRWGDAELLADDTLWVRSGAYANETRTWAAGVWSGIEASPLASGHHLAVDAAGNAVMIGEDGAGGLAISRYDGGWQSAVLIDPDAAASERTAVAIAGTAGVIVAWGRERTGGEREAVACVLSGDTCATEQVLGTTGGFDSLGLTVAITPEGTAHAAWIRSGTNENGRSAHARDYSPGAGWSEAYVLFGDASASGEGPRAVILRRHGDDVIGVLSSRRVVASTPYEELYLVRRTGTRLEAWPDPLLPANDGFDMAVSPSGHAIVAAEGLGKVWVSLMSVP